VLRDLAWAYFGLGRIEEAESTMQTSLRTRADFPEAASAREFVDMVSVYRDPSKAVPSMAKLEEKLKREPDHAPALIAVARIYELQGQADAAKAAYEKVLARYPSFAPAYKHLAALQTERFSDYKAAYHYASKAREAYPDDPEVAKLLGIALYRRGDYQRSAQFLKESARKRPGDADLLFYLAMTQRKLKETPDSQETLRQALALNATSKLADEAKRVVTELK
jgi:tetratricopeptide (TPR) repeat protein